MRADFFSSEPPSVGSLLRDTFAALGSCFGVILAVAGIAAVPVTVLIVSMLWALGTFSPNSEDSNGAIVVTVLAVFLVIALAQLTSAALMRAVFQRARGFEVNVRDCLRVGFARLPQVIFVSITAGVLAAVGMVFCVVPGVIASLTFSIAGPVTVIENRGLRATLQRCEKLTKGRLGIIFGAMFVIGLIQLPLSIPAELLKQGSPGVAAVLNLASMAVNVPLQAALGAVLYYRLRLDKEGIDVEQLATVFE
jgi:hypothetical protein